MSGVLQFMCHYIDVIEKGVTFWPTLCVYLSVSLYLQVGLCMSISVYVCYSVCIGRTAVMSDSRTKHHSSTQCILVIPVRWPGTICLRLRECLSHCLFH